MPAISESAGWGPASWWPRSNFAGCKDTNRFPSFSENWKRWFLPRRRLSNAGRRRRVSYARAATFNGKSGDPFLEAIRHMLAEYAGQVPIQSLMQKKWDESIPNDIAQLQGKRFVTSSETEAGKALN